MSAKGYVELTLKFEREGSLWVGTCLELSTSTYSPSLDQVQSDLRELIVEHLNLLEDAGERERFFGEHGIHFSPVKPVAHEIRLPSIGVDLLLQDVVPLYQPRIFHVGGSEPQTALAGVELH